MEGTEATCMPCVQRLEQIEGFPTTHLAHDDSVRPVPQRCLQQVADGHGWQSGLFPAGFKPHEVALANVEFRYVFDKENSFIIRNGISKDIQKRSLATACASADEDILAVADLLAEQYGSFCAERAVFNKVSHREVSGVKFADRQRNSIDAARWKHCGHAAPIWQAGIQDRLLFGDIIPQSAGNVLHCRIQSLLRKYDSINCFKFTISLDENSGAGVHHNFIERNGELEAVDGIEIGRAHV